MTLRFPETRRAVEGMRVDSITGSLFHGDETVLIFDVDGVLVRQIPTYFHGVRGRDSYVVDREASRLLKIAEKRVDHVVLWSRAPNYQLAVGGRLFNGVPCHLLGCHTSSPDGLEAYKDMRVVQSNTSKVVGIEDDGMFYPRDRVVNIHRGRSLAVAVWEALDKL